MTEFIVYNVLPVLFVMLVLCVIAMCVRDFLNHMASQWARQERDLYRIDYDLNRLSDARDALSKHHTAKAESANDPDTTDSTVTD